MGALDVLSLRIGKVTEIAKAEGRGGDGGGGAGDAVGRLEVVWRGRAEELLVHPGADDLAQRAALHRPASDGECSVGGPGPAVSEAEGRPGVVLQRTEESR